MIRAILTDLFACLCIAVTLYAVLLIGAGLTPTEYLP